MVATISREDLKSKIEGHDNFILVDALPEASFTECHLPGALNLPADEVKAKAARLLPDKHVEIVVYCANPT